MKPVEGSRKVLILEEFHLVADHTAGRLLKTVEEPPGGTLFVILAEDVARRAGDHRLALRHRRAPALTPDGGRPGAGGRGPGRRRGRRGRAAADGDLDRARLLATDERFALRVAAWRDLPRRLDGTGAVAAEVVGELRAAIEDAESTLHDRQEVEVADLEERIERYGQRGAGARRLEESHRRQLRRVRTDEVRMGLGELAHAYRDALVAAGPDEVDGPARALEAINEASDALVRNPNEELLLQALLLRLPPGR